MIICACCSIRFVGLSMATCLFFYKNICLVLNNRFFVWFSMLVICTAKNNIFLIRIKWHLSGSQWHLLTRYYLHYSHQHLSCKCHYSQQPCRHAKVSQRGVSVNRLTMRGGLPLPSYHDQQLHLIGAENLDDGFGRTSPSARAEFRLEGM